MIIVPDYILNLIDCFEKNGFEIFLVGGCIRDALLGRSVNDYDLTTNARPEEMHSILNDYKIIDTSLKHGTVSVLCCENTVEITTYRKESEYYDRRHPDSVEFVNDLKDDLSRRDLTINAIAYNPRVGFVDCFGGIKDINRKLIRFVGDADERVKEDALRILRAIRFSMLDNSFVIDPHAMNAVYNNRKLLCEISFERIRDEIIKIICADNISDILYSSIDVFEYILPELYIQKGYNQNTPYHSYDLLKHTLLVMDNCSNDIVVRLAALFHDSGKPFVAARDEIKGVTHYKGHSQKSKEIANIALKRLRFDNKTVQNACELILYHDHHIKAEKAYVKKLLSLLGEKQFFRLIQLQMADNSSKGRGVNERYENCKAVKGIAEKIIENKECYSLDRLEIDGKDIIYYFNLHGKDVGKALNFALEAVINEKCANYKNAIVDYLSKNILNCEEKH